MNPRAEQYLDLSAVFRERAHQLDKAFVAAGTSLPQSAIPPTVVDPQVMGFASEAVPTADTADACRELEVRCIYSAVLADPECEDEILAVEELHLAGPKLERLKRFAIEYSRSVDEDAAADKKYQKEIGHGKAPAWLRVVFILAAFLVAAAGGFGYWAHKKAEQFLATPAGSAGTAARVVVPRGATAGSVSRTLRRAQVVRSERMFFYLLRYYPYWRKVFPRLKRPRSVRAGTYSIRTNLPPTMVLAILWKGPARPSVKVTIPEGFNVWKIAARLEVKGVCRSQDFLRLARSSDYARKLLRFDAPSLEGYLYPDTYRFHKGSPVESVIKRMVGRFRQVFKAAWKKEAAAYGWKVHQVTTMASVIEKETGVGQERPLISSVFHNRLKRNWKLESDPTTIYGLLPGFNGNLTARDLHSPHLYNTYKHKGLPPGPIASPGRSALVAAIRPVKRNYMFFVARGDGTHAFSRSKAQHLRNVARYQLKGRKPRSAVSPGKTGR